MRKTKQRQRETRSIFGNEATNLLIGSVCPYLFFILIAPLPNRSLTRSALNSPPVSTGETDMSDLIFIALGGGTLLVLALYARALDRL